MDVQHIDINTVRPDAIIRSGVIQPFPMETGPYVVADRAASSFAPGGLSGFGESGYEPLPEEVAMMAKRLATAMGQGLMPVGVVDQNLMKAARLIMAGQEFTITSAGRSAIVRGSNLAAVAPLSFTATTDEARQARRFATR